MSIPMEYLDLFHMRLEALYASRFADVAESLGDDAQAKAREYARDRLSLSLVLQACGRCIRGMDDRCAFVLLDRRYHEYGWRRFLEPRPYNLSDLQRTMIGFRSRGKHNPMNQWDESLVCTGSPINI